MNYLDFIDSAKSDNDIKHGLFLVRVHSLQLNSIMRYLVKGPNFPKPMKGNSHLAKLNNEFISNSRGVISATGMLNATMNGRNEQKAKIRYSEDYEFSAYMHDFIDVVCKMPPEKQAQVLAFLKGIADGTVTLFND